MTSRRGAVKLGQASITTAVLPQMARAQAQWPMQPLKIIVPYPTGVNDAVTRMLSDHLRSHLGHAVVVDNRGGDGGTIGIDGVARADDGHTLAFAAISPLTLNPHVMKVQYDPLKDFVPVASVMYSPAYVMATHRFKGASFSDAIAIAKAAAVRVSIPSSGYGTLGHRLMDRDLHESLRLAPFDARPTRVNCSPKCELGRQAHQRRRMMRCKKRSIGWQIITSCGMSEREAPLLGVSVHFRKVYEITKNEIRSS